MVRSRKPSGQMRFGLVSLTFQPLHPEMPKKLDAIKTANSIKNPANNLINNPINNPINGPIYKPINNPINNPINAKKRKLENWTKNKQTVQDNADLSATGKMSDGKHASIFHWHTIHSVQIAEHVCGM